MEYKMIIRQTMFGFLMTEKGDLQLCSVKFLRDGLMKKKNDLLLVTEKGTVQFFVGGTTPLAKLTHEQFRFVTAATRFFGHLPEQKELPVWLWADSLKMDKAEGEYLFSALPNQRVCSEPALCS